MLTAEHTEFITVEEAAVRAGVSSVTVRRAVRNNELHYRRREGVTKLLAAVEVDAWAERRRQIPPAEGGDQ